MIELIDVSKIYGSGKVALHPTSVRFGRGELVWLSGRSGSGKSTLLGIASLLVLETTGTVIVEGQKIARDDTTRNLVRARRFGIVPQAPRLFAELTPAQNVMLAAPSITREDAERALGLVGLRQRAARSVKTMSGGEQQRVSIARALAKDPDVLFADEPTSSLDDANASAIWGILRDAVDSGRAVVVASHDARIAGHADRRVAIGAV